ncbi:hypothetical protein DAPPUDRAFT_308966 [Daphnia pulex]|uniref:BRISC and BRCA1-A complex member 2 n=1 Tax=Daphnia pulex TaxID=6669 RepID=E9G495_DAPPU|nr:hypothetical protein DAPPUDRAFT_308966 [Daphnia pulex]|eukprot:EFX85715.1 hypothetical protein DAPPUDRAFT_308966 [Daphnia pulex]
MDDMENKIHPSFSDLVETALDFEYPGGPLELSKVTSEDDFVKPYTGHHFTFRIPYSGTFVEWEILFDPENPTQPPDFVCADDINCDPDSYCQMMQFWDLQSPDCLAKLVSQLIHIYKEYQISQILGFGKAAETYHSLVTAGVLVENIEACYLSRERKFNFLIKLNVNDEDLPVVKGLGSILVYAGLLFSLGMDGKILTHSLVISPYLERLLGSQLLDQLQSTSSFSQNIDALVLNDFSLSLYRILKKVRENHKRRRDTVSTLLGLYPTNVVFYDEELYSHIILLFKLDDARYVTHLELNDEAKFIFFAMDCPVKIAKEETIPYTETETLSFAHKPSTAEFSKYLHKTLSSKLKLFVNRALKSVTPA